MQTKKILSMALLSVMALTAFAADPNPKMAKTIDEGMKLAMSHAMRMYEAVKDQGETCFPSSAEADGTLKLTKARDWVSGFFPGELWYIYEYTQDERVRKAAEDMTLRMESQQYNTNSHDVGFMVNCSYGQAYRLTGKEEYRQVLVNAANSLATRFHPQIGCTRSWNRKTDGWQFVVIIDNMMNLELLTVGSGLTGDMTCYNVAKSHADCTLENHFRPDGSSYHVVNYDTLTFKVHNRFTHQGLSDDSAWSRGQGWGLYGFTMMYRQTGDPRYLAQAVKIGQFLMNHPNLPKDLVPYWDYDVKGDAQTPRDASAAALIASALIELSEYVEDAELSQKFLRHAEKTLVSLSGPRYSAKKGTNGNFLIRHCTAFYAKDRDVDAPLPYADYYYVEALMRYRNLLQGRPVVDLRTAYSENKDREIWLNALDRVARPLLENMARGELKKNMPVESINTDLSTRYACTHLEALGRLIVGIAPWLELGPDNSPEGRLRAKYIDLAIKAIDNGVDPQSPDYLNFNKGRQPLVDAAFLAHGLLRAPKQLWSRLSPITRERLVNELKSSRVIKPSETNWLFFSAMVEAALLHFTGEWEPERVKYALDRHKEWYKGDGWYGDGQDFHLDYYNSFVIQPMMMTVLDVMAAHHIEGAEFMEIQEARYARYAAHQERLISPEGTYPAVGRSLAYRFGAFQALSDASYRHLLPSPINPAQVRCALTAVIGRQINAPGTFTDLGGWLRVGFCGYQPHIGETYISTGSVYLCAAGFVALGLPASDPFWNAPAALWTSQQAWGGIDLNVDKAIKK